MQRAQIRSSHVSAGKDVAVEFVRTAQLTPQHFPHHRFTPRLPPQSTTFRDFLQQSTALGRIPLEASRRLRQSASNATGWNDLKRVITERAQRNVILELPRLLPRARRCKVLGRFTPANVTRKHDGSEAGVPRRSLRDQRRGGADVHRIWVGGVQGPQGTWIRGN
jgi:hypothetical protein